MSTTPTAEQIHYMEDHVNEASVPSIYISSGILAGASTIAIILRFLARRISRSCLGKDDYTIFIGYGAITIASTYYFGIALVKYSILFLYHRLFPGKTFRNALLVTAALITAWFIPTSVIGVLMYLPIESKWNFSVNGTCIDYGKAMVAMDVINVMIDFMVLAIPMPILWKVQMTTRRKTLLSGAFAAGGMYVARS
ncbi:putative Integral membrane protein [Seiridium unicorne]|uniref:Integral membrane protein n=1 Tax=Seiridium unicorne TaxID=138068 RepID=A0ABR2URJ8_9PEZI